MAIQKPGIPKGTRDFLPLEIAGRELIFNTVRRIFQLHGFKPIETPAMENLSTLLGKYGEEGDRLIFRILNSGDFASKVEEEIWQGRDTGRLTPQITEKGLRYDLTVPFARFVVQYQNEITFPFKRYQIQPVWRADRPQKGRYREFFQCDVDVVGSDSLVNEAEFLQIIDEVFASLGIKVIIKVNNRKILAGIAQYIGFEEKLTDITVAIDKMEKIGLEKVNGELLERGLSLEAIEKLKPVLLLRGSDKEKLGVLSELLKSSEVGLKGIEEIREVFDIISNTPLGCALELDLTLARGLNYYTGAIIEVKACEVSMGSICGGGRYDDLTGIFGLPGTSGVGISFGADRIYDVMKELDLFPEGMGSFSKVLAVNFGERERNYCLPLLQKLRLHGISCEMYPEPAKMKKQMQYADKNRIPFVVLAGDSEISQGLYSLKNMKSGEQQQLPAESLIKIITHHP
ncbi:MAG: histidine--tRNA ligase [Bacteroidales bacterium]|jgi:histidyl-tRNA synthetase|nr:histidine--tRNA ligase [Bacteroidales bacterium]